MFCFPNVGFVIIRLKITVSSHQIPYSPCAYVRSICFINFSLYILLISFYHINFPEAFIEKTKHTS